MSELKLDSFSILLKGFYSIIENYPSIESVKEDLLELKEAAKIDAELTEHQKVAVISRCNNYLNNDYGDQRKSNDTRSSYLKA